MGNQQPLHISGGLANLAPLCQKLANLSQQPVICPTQTEATARGLAWLIAGRPTTWKQSNVISFMPQTDQALRARYIEWTRQLEVVIRLVQQLLST